MNRLFLPAALSLHLLQICLIYINTLLVQRVLAEPRHYQAMQPADWRGLTPLFYQHVNPYGACHLAMNERMQIEIEEEEATAWPRLLSGPLQALHASYSQC